MSNYSMHAIIQAVSIIRENPSKKIMIVANGGYNTKQSVGIYGNNPPVIPWDDRDDSEIQQFIISKSLAEPIEEAHSQITVEAYTIFYDREGMPLVRYNSHDLGRIIPDICHCGLPLKRIEIKGRTDDMVPIGAGDNLYTNIFDEIIYTIPEVIEYRVVFDRKHDKDVIMVIAESRVRNNTLERKIKDAVLSISKIRDGIERSKTISSPKVKLVKPNTFDRKSIKMRRLVDNRNLYD